LLDDVFVEGVPVLTKGSKISGVIAEAELKSALMRLDGHHHSRQAPRRTLEGET
jgi:hypothetical protein